MSTGKEAFSLTRFVLPSVFMQKVHFQLTCVAKRSLCFTSGRGGGVLTNSRFMYVPLDGVAFS